jgi:hypothetical protein
LIPHPNPSSAENAALNINSMSSSAEQNKLVTQEPDWDFLEYVSTLEKEWKENLRVTLPASEAGWLKIFPEAKAILPAKVKEWRIAALEARDEIRVALQVIEEKCSDDDNKSFWKAVLKYTHPAVRQLAFAQKRVRSLLLLMPSKSSNRGKKWQKTFTTAKERNLVEVAQAYSLKLKKAGKTYQTLCPAHSERTPSFTIYPPSRYVCFGCGIKGTVIDFVMLMDGCSAKEAAEKLQRL